MQSPQLSKRNGENAAMIVSDSFPIDWAHGRETRLLLRGQGNVIELLINGVSNPRAMALICHPHPLHGGSLDNKVAFTLARACRDSDIVAVRFNFRGVGLSGGIYNDGVGELEDARWLFARLQMELPNLPVVLAGFSFGAAIVAQLAEMTSCAGLLLSAPPVSRYGLGQATTIVAPVLLLQCDDDEVIESARVYDWFDQLLVPKKILLRWKQGGHFFHGMLPELKSSAEKFLLDLGI